MATIIPVGNHATLPGYREATASDTTSIPGTLTVAGATTLSTMTSGSVIFAGAAGLLSQDNSSFFWDATNKRLGIGIGTSPTAALHLKAGTTAAGTAPIKLTSGSLLTAPEVGAIEFLTDAVYVTITTGAARKALAFAADVVPNSRTITAGAGLTGGGDLSANRTLDVGAGTGITVNADDVAVNQAYAFTWTGVTTWKTHAAFTGSGLVQETAALQTTTNTTGSLWTLALADTFVYGMEIMVVARNTDGSQRAMWKFNVNAYREGSGAVLSDVTLAYANPNNPVAWVVDVDTDGSNTVRLRVTGENSKTINWVATVRRQGVSSSA